MQISQLRRLVKRIGLASALTVVITASAHAQGRIYVDADDWTTSASSANAGVNLANPTTYITNIANWLTGGSPGSVLISSSDGVSLDNYLVTDGLTNGGYSYLIDASDAAFGSLGGYKAVFVDLTGAPGTNDATMSTELSNYVLGGGNVFLEVVPLLCTAKRDRLTGSASIRPRPEGAAG